MKIIDINKKKFSDAIIPHYNLSSDSIDTIFETFRKIAHEEVNNFEGECTSEDMRVVFSRSFQRLQDTLFVKDLVKKKIIDKHFFEFYESFINDSAEEGTLEQKPENTNNEESTQGLSRRKTIEESFKKAGIPSEDTTHLHIGETTIMLSKSQKEEQDDDSAETMMRNLNRRR